MGWVQNIRAESFFRLPKDRLYRLVTNGDPRVTIVAGRHALTLTRDDLMDSDPRHSLDRGAGPAFNEFVVDGDYHDAVIKVSDRIRDMLNSEQLEIRFGDPEKPTYAFVSNLDGGQYWISDLERYCR